MLSLLDIIKKSQTHYLMKNASPSEKDDGSMIKYWEDKTGLDLQEKMWQCPKCGHWFNRAHLDGSHVVILFSTKNHPQYITPLCHNCNRSRDNKTFWVIKKYVVSAP